MDITFEVKIAVEIMLTLELKLHIFLTCFLFSGNIVKLQAVVFVAELNCKGTYSLTTKIESKHTWRTIFLFL